MPKAELHIAYFWICDNCGRDNFCRSISYKPTAEEAAELSEGYGLTTDEFVDGAWQTRPDRVTCEHCKAEFEATDPEADHG